MNEELDMMKRLYKEAVLNIASLEAQIVQLEAALAATILSQGSNKMFVAQDTVDRATTAKKITALPSEDGAGYDFEVVLEDAGDEV